MGLRVRIVGIIQARMGSTRLPGKVLRELGGRSVLGWVVRAVREAAAIDDLVVSMLASSKASAERSKICIMRAETSRYKVKLGRINTVAGSPLRRAASASRQARAMGKAE